LAVKTQKNLSKEAVGAFLDSSRPASPNRRQEKSYPAQNNKKAKELQISMLLLNAGTQTTNILSYCARRSADNQYLA